MALHIPSNLYSGNAVVLDTRQPMQYYMQRMATQQAKNQALDSYYDKLHTAINPAGMRVQDIEGGFNSKVGDWKNFYNQNKAAIKDPSLDNGKAYNEHMARYQDLLGDTEKSKEAAKKEMIIAPYKLSGKWEPTDGDMPILHGMSSSIYSPDHKKEDGVTPYGIEDLSVSHPDFTPQLQNQFLKAAVGDLKPGYEEQDLRNAVIDKEHGKQSIPYTKRFADDQLKQIGDRGAYLYDGSKSAKKFFEKELLDPDEHAQLNETYRRVYGKDIETPKEAAQAWTIHANLAAKETGNKIMNWTDPNKSFALKAAGFEYSKKLVEFKKRLGVSDTEDDYKDPMESSMKKIEEGAVPGNAPIIEHGKEPINAKILPATPELKKVFRRQDGMHMVDPDEIKETEDGNIIGIFYQRDSNNIPKEANGKYLISQSLKPVIMPREQVKLALAGQMMTKKSQETRINKTSQQSNKPKKTKDDPLGILE